MKFLTSNFPGFEISCNEISYFEISVCEISSNEFSDYPRELANEDHSSPPLSGAYTYN